MAARAVVTAAVETYRRYLESVDGLTGGGPAVAGATAVGMRVSLLQGAVATAAASGNAATAAQVSAAAFAADGLRRQALDLMDRARTQVKRCRGPGGGGAALRIGGRA